MKTKLVKLLKAIAIAFVILIVGYLIANHFITFHVKQLKKEENILMDDFNIDEKLQVYEDANGDIAYIPRDFKVSEKEDEQTVHTGLVVIRTRWK